MARQLLWVAAPEPKVDASVERDRHKAYRAPSWSWASTDQLLKTVLQWDYRGTRNQRDFLVDVLDADVVPAEGNDAFGQIASAELRLRGKLIRVCLVKELDYGVGKESTGRYKIMLDGHRLNDVTVFEDRGIDRYDSGGIFFCLPISVSISLPEVSLDRRTLVYGLLLEKIGVEEKYRRLGVFMAPSGEAFLMGRGVEGSEKGLGTRTFDWRNCTQWHGEGGKGFGEDVFVLY